MRMSNAAKAMALYEEERDINGHIIGIRPIEEYAMGQHAPMSFTKKAIYRRVKRNKKRKKRGKGSKHISEGMVT